VLAYLAFRGRSNSPFPIQVASAPPSIAPEPTPSAPAAAPADANAKPSPSSSTAGTTPAVDRGVATAGAGPAASKPTARGTLPPPPGATTPATDSGVPAPPGGRGKEPVVPAAPTPAVAAAAAVPLATFNQVRVLVNDGEKARERVGILHVGEGQVALMPAGGSAAIISLPISSVNAIYYARSRQPKWRDASGKEVESRIDLGRMGFLRGERNWIVLLTAGDPVILRIEDSALRTVLPALEERTGRKIQR
jgi:hypothetical protein